MNHVPIQEVLRLEKEMGHEDRGSPTLFLDVAPVASSGVDSGFRVCMVWISVESRRVRSR